VPVPHLENFHPTASLVNAPAVLLMDNSGVHLGANTMVLFAENDVTVITFPPHMSGIFQMLDLVFFSVFKPAKRKIPRIQQLRAVDDAWPRAVDVQDPRSSCHMFDDEKFRHGRRIHLCEPLSIGNDL
jgi:hypothetical protein